MAHPDLDRLLDFCIPFAQDQLKKRDQFYPFAAAIHSDGEITPLAIDDGNDKPVPTEMIAAFIELLRSFVPKGGLEATAICYDGRVTVPGKDKQDAITVSLEHVNGEVATIYLPYSKKLFRGYQYGEIIGTAEEPKIFN
jgi:hypothetical protein